MSIKQRVALCVALDASGDSRMATSRLHLGLYANTSEFGFYPFGRLPAFTCKSGICRNRLNFKKIKQASQGGITILVKAGKNGIKLRHYQSIL
jgi:hypothetical protein